MGAVRHSRTNISAEGTEGLGLRYRSVNREYYASGICRLSHLDLTRKGKELADVRADLAIVRWIS
jgi:hypothetical protein